VDPDGRVVCDLQGRYGYRFVTGVREHRGTLYLGSLVESGIARLRIGGQGYPARAPGAGAAW
jgi:hypothetical protein